VMDTLCLCLLSTIMSLSFRFIVNVTFGAIDG
jgi:hypothetical protein